MEIKKVADRDVYFFDSVDSTMDAARSLYEKGKEFVVVARLQTKGRGRLGRKWVSNEGGLWLSVVWESVSKEVLDYLFLITAKAVVDTLKNLGIESKIKLPNDVYVENKKIAGILIENTSENVIIGVGINVNNPLKKEMDNATSCQEVSGRRIEIETVLQSFLVNLDNSRKRFEKTRSDFLTDIKRFLQ